jgi:hypothetical protein
VSILVDREIELQGLVQAFVKGGLITRPTRQDCLRDGATFLDAFAMSLDMQLRKSFAARVGRSLRLAAVARWLLADLAAHVTPPETPDGGGVAVMRKVLLPTALALINSKCPIEAADAERMRALDLGTREGCLEAAAVLRSYRQQIRNLFAPPSDMGQPAGPGAVLMDHALHHTIWTARCLGGDSGQGSSTDGGVQRGTGEHAGAAMGILFRLDRSSAVSAPALIQMAYAAAAGNELVDPVAALVMPKIRVGLKLWEP